MESIAAIAPAETTDELNRARMTRSLDGHAALAADSLEREANTLVKPRIVHDAHVTSAHEMMQREAIAAQALPPRL